MKPIGYTLKNLSRLDYFKKHLEIVTIILPGSITKTEILVLASFMSLQGDIVADDRFGTSARKIVRDKLKMSPGGLGNHLRSLEDNKYIYKNDKGKFEINKYLIPSSEKVQSYQFNIVCNE